MSKSSAVAGSTGPSFARRRRWIPISLLSLAALINYLDRGSLSVALPFVARDMQLDPLQQGWALAAFSITYTLFQLPAGWMADRWRLKWLYAGAFALWCLASAATGLAGDLAMLIFFRLLLGIGESINLPGGLRFISEQFDSHERAVPSAIFDVGCKAGLAIGLVVEAWILRNFGWSWMFLSTGLIGLLWLLPWLLLYPAPSIAAASRRAAPPLSALIGIVRSRNTWGMAAGFFCWNYFWYLLISWGPSYLYTVRRISLSHLGWVAGGIYLVIACSEITGGWLTGVLMRRGWSVTRSIKTIIVVGFSLGLFVMPACLATGRNLALLFLYISALSGVLISAILVVPQQCAPPNEVGSYVSFQNFIGNLPGIIGPVITGWIVRRSGSFVPAFSIGAVACVGGIACYVWWMKTFKSENTSRNVNAADQAIFE
ncbi:MFS transporter [Alloacidobacterium dinghuense]|uniref:MFS transporter n=1 Tax=Alloacidobacterium dinghuense TaxID=2763107 RepID=A0A7G8BDA0_9BACT|nr:MFS transporter [Alloacidobacterium dinghuense]QNI30520.1 MFS transporter [Alloacidobacterium dinghuense]